MTLPDADRAVIAPEKLTAYLLVQRPDNDKSRFLARAGFTTENSIDLLIALRRLVETGDATEDGISDYGTFYRVDGRLIGPLGSVLDVTTIWMRRLDDSLHFVTLKPSRGRGPKS